MLQSQLGKCMAVPICTICADKYHFTYRHDRVIVNNHVGQRRCVLCTSNGINISFIMVKEGKYCIEPLPYYRGE